MSFFPWLRRIFYDLREFGHSAIAAVQSIENPVFDGFFHVVTLLGDEIGYLLLLPLIYWCIDAKLGRRLGLLVFGGLAANFSSKMILGIPRPTSRLVNVLVEPGSPSMPSGHAQGSVLMWGFVWVWWRDRLSQWQIPLLIVLIGFSRIYLGAHFPQDIVVGWLFGVALVWLFVMADRKGSAWLAQRAMWVQWLLLVLLVLGYLGLHLLPFRRMIPYNPSMGALKGLAATLGAFLGFGLGIAAERRFVRFSTSGALGQRVLRFLVGAVAVAAVYVGAKLLMPPHDLLWRLVRYCLVGFTAALVPLLFVKLKLAATEVVDGSLEGRTANVSE